MRFSLPTLTILDEDTCRQVYEEALEILRVKGFRVYSPEMRGRLRGAGASVDDAREMVTVPSELVAEAVAACPASFDLYDLDGDPMRFAAGTILETIGTYVEAIEWLDYGAKALRPSTLSDLQNALKIADALPLVRRTGTIVCPNDVPLERQLRASLRAILTTTRKPFSFGIQNREHARIIFEALSVAAPELDIRKHPPAGFASSPTSPLTLDRDSAEVLIFGLEHGLIPTLAPCPMAGGTSPFSIMGTVLQQVAENLFMLSAKFAVDPEAPVLWGGAAGPMDMRTGDVSYGGIERSLMMLANIDMADYFGLPCHSPAGSADSCLIDAQLGAEKTWTFLTRSLSRAATGIGIGAITNGRGVSAEQMVIDMDILGCVRRLAAGIEMDHLEPASREIMQMDPGGNFLMNEATLELLQEGEEYFYPLTFNREGTHAPSIMQRAYDEVERMLSEWTCPVPEKIRAEIESFLDSTG